MSLLLFQDGIQNADNMTCNDYNLMIPRLEAIAERFAAPGPTALGLGRFKVRRKQERQGRNRRSGDPVEISSRHVLTFECSGVLRAKLNSQQKQESIRPARETRR
jgi:hypothetical protein